MIELNTIMENIGYRGNQLYFLREISKQKYLNTNCKNTAPYGVLIDFLLKENILEAVKFGFDLSRNCLFPLVLRVSEKGDVLLKEELGEF